MTSIGEKLRRQRLQNKVSIEKIALDTKIGVRLLEAIEAEQFEKLPGGVFRKSFVLQYAQALGIQPDEIANDLQNLRHFDEVPAIPTADMLKGHDRKSGSLFNLGGGNGSTLGSLLAAVGVIMACALIYAWWQTPREATTKVETVAANRAPDSRAASASSAPAPTPSASQSDAPAMNQSPAAAVSQTPATPSSQAPAMSTASPSDGAAVRVGVIADEKTWVSISSDGKNVFSDALEPRETKMIEASAKVRLLVGNAGGIEISLNGKPIGPIGPKGQIRIVELTPAGFQIVQRKPATAEPL